MDQFNDLAINIIASAVYTGIEMAARSLARRISDPEKQELEHVIKRAFVGTFPKLLAEINDPTLRLHIEDLLRKFVKDQRVYEFILRLALDGTPPDMAQLKAWFEDNGFDEETLPIDFDETIHQLVLNITTELQVSASVADSPLFNQVNIALLAQIVRTLRKPDIYQVARQTTGKFVYHSLTVPVERPQLFRALIQFVTSGNGIVIGQPGSGKSFALNQLSLQLVAKHRVCICLSVTGIHARSDVNALLGIDQDFISYLQGVEFESNEKPGIILIDGFDAARSTETRSFFRELIAEMIQNLNPKWNVVVSVRTYDAKKSEALQDLFPIRSSDSDLKFRMQDVHCRHFLIPQLDDEEVQLAVKNIVGLDSIYQGSSQAFQRLLQVPFNLWLVEKLLLRKPFLPELGSVSSETELLALFWRQRVTDNALSHSLETMLRKAAQRMVEHTDLVVSKESLISQPQDGVVLDELLSLEIFAYRIPFQRNIEFAHNIFFDYAVAVLVLPDDPNQFVAFFSTDYYLPLFLLPSIEYFLASIWLDSSGLFWLIFWQLFQPDTPLQLKLFARLIPPRIIATQSQSYSQVAPLVDGLVARKTNAPIAVASTLRLILTKGIKKSDIWIVLVENLIPYLSREFVVDLAKLTTEIVERSDGTTVNDLVARAGTVGRKLVQWGLSERESSTKSWIDSITARLFLPLVTKTFGTAPGESKELIQQLLSLAQAKRIPVEYLSRVADALDSIATYDPEFVGELYMHVFSSGELGDDAGFVAGIVVQLVMSSKNEREMVEHKFVWYYPRFLKRSTLQATVTGLNCINHLIVKEQILPHLRADKTLEDAIRRFDFRGKQAILIQDATFAMWREPHDHEPLHIAVELFHLIDMLATDNKLDQSNLDGLLNVFRDHAKVAYLWAKLLGIAARHPSIFAVPLFELCVSQAFMLSNEVLQELGSFLTAACPYYTEQQMTALEHTIISLPDNETDIKRREALEHRRNRLLARIPKEKLITQEGRTIQEALELENALPDNNPLVSFSSYSRPYGETEWLKEMGVNLEDEKNQHFRDLYTPLKTFAERWSNETPNDEAIHAILPVVEEVFSTLADGKTDVDENLLDRAWTELAECVERMCHAADSDENVFVPCKAVMLNCAQHRLPEPNPQDDREYNHPGWSPAPRTAAARGLLTLIYHKKDVEVLDSIQLLIQDPVPSVRFCIAHRFFLTYRHSQEFFWQSVATLLENEMNFVVRQAIYGSLMQQPIMSTNQAQTYLKEALNKALETEPDTEFTEYLLGILPWYMFVGKAEWATEIASAILQKPVENAKPLSHLVFDVLRPISVNTLFSLEGKPVALQAIQWIHKALIVARDGIQTLLASSPQDWNDNQRDKLQNLQRVIDSTVNHIFFEADIRDVISDHRDRRELSDSERRDVYFAVKDLLLKISLLALDDKSGIMPAYTAHHFMEIMNGVLKYDPADVLAMATNIARSSQSSGYQFDSMAVREVIELVEKLLADFHNELRDHTVLSNLLTLLDIFSEAGWPEALDLVGRLSEIAR